MLWPFKPEKHIRRKRSFEKFEKFRKSREKERKKEEEESQNQRSQQLFATNTKEISGYENWLSKEKDFLNRLRKFGCEKILRSINDPPDPLFYDGLVPPPPPNAYFIEQYSPADEAFVIEVIKAIQHMKKGGYVELPKEFLSQYSDVPPLFRKVFQPSDETSDFRHVDYRGGDVVERTMYFKIGERKFVLRAVKEMFKYDIEGKLLPENERVKLAYVSIAREE